MEWADETHSKDASNLSKPLHLYVKLKVGAPALCFGPTGAETNWIFYFNVIIGIKLSYQS